MRKHSRLYRASGTKCTAATCAKFSPKSYDKNFKSYISNVTQLTDATLISASPPLRSAAFERFVAPARRRPAFWRLIAGLVLMTIIYALGAAVVIVGGWALLDRGSDPITFAQGAADANSPLAVALLLATFLPMALAAMLTVRLIHKRSAASLFGPGARVLRDFAKAAGIVSALYAALMVAWAIFDGNAVPNLAFSVWLTWLPLILLGLVVQTGAEELVFRGYIQQQLAARFVSPLIWLLVPAVMFGAVHFDPLTAGDNLWFVLAGVTLFGLIAGDLTARTGSIGAAWGFHFANNAFAILLISTTGSIDGASLLRTPYALSEAEGFVGLLAVDALVMICAWYLVRRAVSR